MIFVLLNVIQINLAITFIYKNFAMCYISTIMIRHSHLSTISCGREDADIGESKLLFLVLEYEEAKRVKSRRGQNIS
jgi:hypothetical protein